MWLDYILRVCLVLRETLKLSSKCLFHFWSSPIVCEISSCFLSLLGPGVVSVLDFGHSSKCVQVSPCYFHFHLPDNIYCEAFFNTCICHLCIIFGKVSVKVFGLFLFIIIIIFKDLFIFILHKENVQAGGGTKKEGEWESLSRFPTVHGAKWEAWFQDPRLWPTPKSRVRCLTNWVTQVPLTYLWLILKSSCLFSYSWVLRLLGIFKGPLNAQSIKWPILGLAQVIIT